MDRGFRVLIIGCGEIGSRHLQAVSCLSEVREIEVVDPRPEAIGIGKKRLQEMRRVQGGSPKVRWLSRLEEASPGGDLCIVATQARGRCQLVQETAQILGYSNFILEKIVGQSVQELEDLAQFCVNQDLSIWVNLKSRAYPIHQRIKKILKPDEPILFSTVGGNHGLANNGIHAADLFAFYDGSERIQEAASSIDPVLHPSKRGSGLFDLSGTLIGRTERGGRFVLSYAGDHLLSEQISITTRSYRCIVDHNERWAVESNAASGWIWRPAPVDGELLVSQMTREFALDILTQGRCALPTLRESLVAHRFILEAVKPHFNRLLGKEVALCPVT
ncbi:MAG: Gfo/Idh/MocA family oxidoreductase [Candidatus Omnitrophica bacterium]|nr:Gfo/Idh/MocA family oxidoreductase [Candidatus Omnitrophota bacterium]